jgi:fimbrial isopeptide formation D2 family protein/LPXTG-motif cell wall-anchored protein
MTDTLSNGLTAPEAKDVKVTLNTEDGTDLVAANIFEVSVSGQVITVALKENIDLRTADYNGETDGGLFEATDKIIVTYNAVLNENAKIGSEGNPNTVKLDFTNNPNGEQDGKYGTTPEDKVIVFTYEIKALKVEPTSDAAIDQTAYNALTDAQKAEYVKVGDKYQKTQALEGAGFTLYKKVAAGTTGADADGWLKVGNEITGVTTFEFKGTDAGQYKLVETTVPGGYNKAEDVIITVEATYDTEADDPKLKTLTVTPEAAGFTVTTAAVSETDTAHITTNGIVEGDILNQKGSVLPSTGGIGRRIFIVSGSILLVGAAILLITRRRMSAR